MQRNESRETWAPLHLIFAPLPNRMHSPYLGKLKLVSQLPGQPPNKSSFQFIHKKSDFSSTYTFLILILKNPQVDLDPAGVRLVTWLKFPFHDLPLCFVKMEWKRWNLAVPGHLTISCWVTGKSKLLQKRAEQLPVLTTPPCQGACQSAASLG